MKRKLSSILLAILLCFTFASNASASQVNIQNSRHSAMVYSDSTMQPNYALISSIHGACDIVNGKLAMSGTVSSGGLATYAKVTITLQSYNGSKWVDGTSWSATGTTKATKSAGAAPKAGTLYRLKIYGYVSNASTSDSDTIYTNSVAL